MAEITKKRTIDKTETKKNQTVIMAEFRNMILESKIQPTPAITPVFPVAFPTPIFTFTHERRDIFPKVFTYYGVKKDFQP